MTKILEIWPSNRGSVADSPLAGLAKLLGVNVCETAARQIPESQDGFSNRGGRAVALTSETLQAAMKTGWFDDNWGTLDFVFVSGFSGQAGETDALRQLTGGAISAAALLPKAEVTFAFFPTGIPAWPAAGLSYAAVADGFSVFDSNGSQASTTLATANGQPFFVLVPRGQTQIFLLTSEVSVDFAKPADRELSVRELYPQLVAGATFLRTAFGQSCWSAPVLPATVIIDDPYLAARYGFVRYRTLIERLQESRTALTVAFVPYNYRRSDPATVSLLRNQLERFSIAVHGCDHTAGEYASEDLAWLTATTSCAIERMERHETRTGMPFDKVMIFPQGRFSLAALQALETCGLEAAVNSTLWPSDWRQAPLLLRELLDAAVTRYSDMPLFGRRYPRDAFDFAFDALFQKPLFVVEHHGYFRDGYESFQNFTRTISMLNPKVAWMSLGEAVRRFCLVRRTGAQEIALRQFAPTLHWRNDSNADVTVRVEKTQARRPVTGVICNGTGVPFEINSGVLRFQVQISAGEYLDALVESPVHSVAARSVSFRSHVTTWGRRQLSDLRDNYIARSETALALAHAGKRLLSRH